MNILLYDIGSYTQKDLIYYLRKQGFHCQNVLYKTRDYYHDEFFERQFQKQLSLNSYDFVMSTNFSPLVAKLCFANNIKYISWVYDSPINVDYIEYYQYPTSYIFLFDRIEVERITALGGIHIYHMPLAINPNRLQEINISSTDRQKFSSEISFVGQLYLNPLKDIMIFLSDYQKGYIDSICESQLKVYGYNFVEELISNDFLVSVNKNLQANGVKTSLTKRGLMQSINRHITHTERIILLNMLGKDHQVKYYSTDRSELLNNLCYGGTVLYHSEMPKVFHLSRLNLNPTLKSIQSGIPLRALDILSCKGVLVSNYQTELAEYFIDGKDVIMYESIEDALCKADYYLKHEEIRSQIAQNGYEKVIAYFSYTDKIESMLKIAGIL